MSLYVLLSGVAAFLCCLSFRFPFFPRSLDLVVLQVLVVGVEVLDGSGSGSLFCGLLTAVCVFEFTVTCASVFGCCAAVCFVSYVFPMAWAKSSTLMFISIVLSSVVCIFLLIFVSCF